MYDFHTSDQRVKPVYCTGSGMLTRYKHCGQYFFNCTVPISRHNIPKSPQNYQIPSMQPLAACLFI